MDIKNYYRILRALILYFLIFKTNFILFYLKTIKDDLIEKKKFKSQSKSFLVLNPNRGYKEWEETFKQLNKKLGFNILIHDFTFEKKFLSYLLPLNKVEKEYVNPITGETEKQGVPFYNYTSKKQSKFDNYLIENYKKALQIYLKFLKENYNIKYIIAFGIHYKSEVFWDVISKNLNIKYIIYHKESQFGSSDVIEFHKKMLNKVNPFKGYRIFVYNEIARKFFIDSGYVNKKKIIVNGPIRTDKLYKQNKMLKTKEKKIILFYIFGTGITLFHRTNQSDMTHSEFKDYGWVKLLENTYKNLFKLAKEFKNYKFICKGKYKGLIEKNHEDMEKKFGKLPNLIFRDKEKNYEFLKNAKVVVSFGSTVIFEAMMLKKTVVVPFFNEALEKKYKKHVPFAEFKKVDFAKKKEKDFYLSIKKIIKNKINKINHNLFNKSIIKYVGQNDGGNAKRFIDFIKQDQKNPI